MVRNVDAARLALPLKAGKETPYGERRSIFHEPSDWRV